jgi:hypothetical protein
LLMSLMKQRVPMAVLGIREFRGFVIANVVKQS